MSGSSPTPAEQHLGDRLAALVDGELGHDARERVLAHLATCTKCKAEADAQRRLKSLFVETAPPPPSEGLLARLQGLPGGGDDGRGTPFGSGAFGNGVFGVGSEAPGSLGPLGYVPGGSHAMVLPERGFRIHDVGGREADRQAWRGRRFAFAAAGAVSLAAIALGGALPLDTAVEPRARGEGGAHVTPLRATATPSATRGVTGPAARRHGGAAGIQDVSETVEAGPLGSSVPPALMVPVAFPTSAAPLAPLAPPFAAAVTGSTGAPLIRPAGQTGTAKATPKATSKAQAPTLPPAPSRLAAHPGRQAFNGR
ncbi:zf-HC2 domain-containing protein [Streptomyces sp. A3M-1-3]|uniref:anti-sigma factor family protein n=1 Tax=Streptomyces sp. A3M-1-3 TaxID=2962044 RepID=UPI0020B6A90C|nr:zf-HC2 domain-containing protein [Streptomyces sp. A3M-1-3]MCP3820800.1 zf-HC2 domain-containing protein [Streptomyces sp. A3M-1-3]